MDGVHTGDMTTRTATAAQVDYIVRLAEERGAQITEAAVAATRAMSTAQASAYIERLKATPVPASAPASVQQRNYLADLGADGTSLTRGEASHLIATLRSTAAAKARATGSALSVGGEVWDNA